MKNKKLKRTIKNFLPWIICLAIFYYLFTQIPPTEILTALKFVHLPTLVFYSLAYFMLVLLMDCVAIKYFISRFSTPVTFRESLMVRGVSYLVMILNYHAAQGAFAIYFKKTHSASIAKTLGTLAFTSIADLLLIFTSALIALSVSEVTYSNYNLQAMALKIAPTLYIGYTIWILFWKNIHRPMFNGFRQYKMVNWILSHNIFLIFREARLKDYLLLLMTRLPLIVLILAGFNGALLAYHSWLKWTDVYLYGPIVMFVSTLPLTPAGLGTGQLLTIEFFKNKVVSPQVTQGLITSANLLFTSTILWTLANQIYKAIYGVFCLRQTSKDLLTETLAEG